MTFFLRGRFGTFMETPVGVLREAHGSSMGASWVGHGNAWKSMEVHGRPREPQGNRWAPLNLLPIGDPWAPVGDPLDIHREIHGRQWEPTVNLWLPMAANWRPMDVNGLMGAHERPIGAHGNPVDLHGRPMGAHGRPICTITGARKSP